MPAKPILGIVGGIGSGKTFVARLFGELGCLVIEADALVREAYEDPAVRAVLRDWWGEDMFRDGVIDRAAIARKVFNDPEQRRRLEGLLHPWVNARRQVIQQEADPATVAFVWDTPLLFETGLNRQCDAVIFVDVPEEMRLLRVAAQRGWDASELHRRENLQWPLDNKRRMSDYIVTNAEPAAPSDSGPAGDLHTSIRSQVRSILSRIVAGLPASR